jgi:molybdate transport system substrate-binding protein
MDQLDIRAAATVNPDGLDFVLQGSRFNIVENRLVMIAPEGMENDIGSFEDALGDKVRLIALGNSDVPAGQYAQEVFASLGVWDALVADNKISYGGNVKEVLEQVASASVDCGVVYSTDAATTTGVIVVAYAPAGSHKPIVYPAAILRGASHVAEAEAFMTFLKSEACVQVFLSIGFSIPQN